MSGSTEIAPSLLSPPPVADPGKGATAVSEELQKYEIAELKKKHPDDKRRFDAASSEVNKNIKEFHEKLDAIRQDRVKYAAVIARMNQIVADWAKKDPTTRGSLAATLNGPNGPFTEGMLRGTGLLGK